MRRNRLLAAAATMLAALVLPAAASASGGFEAGTYPVTLKDGSVKSTVKFVFQGEEAAGSTNCEETSLEGSAAERSVTMALSIAWKCRGVLLKTNGCKVEFHPGSENTMDIGPAGCGPITGLLLHNGSCEVSIPAQTGIPVTFTNEVVKGFERINAAAASTLKYTEVKGCGGTHPTLEFNGSWQVSGYSAAGELTNIHSTDSFSAGLFLTGKKSEVESEQPKFAAEHYPGLVSGKQDAGAPFSFKSAVLENKQTCGTGEANGSLPVTAAAVSLVGTFASCKYGSESVTVKANSCSFSLSVANSGPPYTGGIGISCSKGGDAIELVQSNCTIKVWPQNTSSTVQYENLGSGASRTVHAAVKAEKLSYRLSAGICQLLGFEHSDGTLEWGLALQGGF